MDKLRKDSASSRPQLSTGTQDLEDKAWAGFQTPTDLLAGNLVQSMVLPTMSSLKSYDYLNFSLGQYKLS